MTSQQIFQITFKKSFPYSSTPKQRAYEKFARLTLMKLTPGLNFINVLRTALARAEPKSVKKESQVVNKAYTLLGSARAKAVRKYVGEIDP